MTKMLFKIQGPRQSPFEIAVCTDCNKAVLIRSRAWFHCSPEQLKDLIDSMQHALKHLETEVADEAAQEAKEGA